MVSAIDVGRARLGGVLALAERSDAYRDLASRLEDRQRLIVADANAGARAFAWSALVAENARTVALGAPREDRARRWRAGVAGWLGVARGQAAPAGAAVRPRDRAGARGAPRARGVGSASAGRRRRRPRPLRVLATPRCAPGGWVRPRRGRVGAVPGRDGVPPRPSRGSRDGGFRGHGRARSRTRRARGAGGGAPRRSCRTGPAGLGLPSAIRAAFPHRRAGDRVRRGARGGWAERGAAGGGRTCELRRPAERTHP